MVDTVFLNDLRNTGSAFEGVDVEGMGVEGDSGGNEYACRTAEGRRVVGKYNALAFDLRGSLY